MRACEFIIEDRDRAPEISRLIEHFIAGTTVRAVALRG